jgi:plasmid maintenance system killer protein
MLIEYKTPQLKKFCETSNLGSRRWGDQVMKMVEQRLYQLKAVRNLEDLRNLAPGANPHPLKGKYAGKFGVHLHGGYRMIFEATNDPSEYETADGVDRRKITAIRILEVKDYHD